MKFSSKFNFEINNEIHNNIFLNKDKYKQLIYSKILLSHLFGQNVSLWKISHNLIINFDEFTELKDQNLSRLKIGIYLRKIKGNNLIKMIFISLSNEYVEKFSNNKILNEINMEKLNELFKKYYEIYEFVDKENLFKINELKPILNGKDILNYFPETENKQMNFLINSLIEEQIKTKNTLSRKEAIEILKNKINK